MTHEEKMGKTWRLIADLSITESPREVDKNYLVENIYTVRDAFYADIESGKEFEDDDIEAFLARHGIEWIDPKTPSDLYAMTGQESGIVVYQNKAVIVCNWANVCPDGGLPVAGPIGGMLICWPDPIKYVDRHDVDDVRDALPGSIIEVDEEDGQKVIEAQNMDIVSDDNGDICALWGYDLGLDAEIYRNDDGSIKPTPGTVYELEGEVIIIAPDGWC